MPPTLPAAMPPRARSTLFRILVAAAVLAAAAPSPVAAQADARTPPALFGVGLGAPAAEVQAAASRAGITCAASAGGAIVCASPLGASPLSGSETLWLDDAGVARAFLVAGVSGSTLAPYERGFATLQAWVTSLLGPPSHTAQAPPWWSSPTVTAERQWQDVVSGRARLEATWKTADAGVRLWLATEQGQVRLVLAMLREPTAADCRPEAIAEALMSLFPPATPAARAASARQLADCRVARTAGALDAAMKHDPAPAVQAEALRALDQIGQSPDDAALRRLAERGPAPVARAAAEIQAVRRARAQQAPPASSEHSPAQAEAEARAKTPPVSAAAAVPPPSAPAAAPPAIAEARPEEPAPAAAPAAPPPPPLDFTAAGAGAGAIDAAGPPAPTAPAEPARRTPIEKLDGTPLAIASSTAAGALLMRNLGLIGLPQLSAQLLIGGAGAVIGFGTSWGLSRFGLRPDLGQAVFYTNTTAWGTLAGLMAWRASGSSSPKIEYGSLVLGEAVGMGTGVWAARRWRWTPAQAVLADTFLVGAALSGAGLDRLQNVTPQTTTPEAIAAPLVMIASAIAAHQMSPTTNDLRLMTFGALGGAWTGGLVVSGSYRASLFDSHQGQGGLMIGAGVGYLGAAAASAFSEAPASSLYVAGAGTVAGNLLGLGVQMAAARDAGGVLTGTLAEGERDRWKLGAGIGGLALGAAAYAYAPHLAPGPYAPSMGLSGMLYGGGTWGLATAAGYHGQPVTDVDSVHLQGGMLIGAVTGGLTGVVASRWFAPDPLSQLTVAATSAAGIAAGLGVAKLTTDAKGTPDSVGVLAGAGTGLLSGILFDRHDQLRAPDFAGAAVGAGYGTLFGTLVPTLRQGAWDDGRKTAGGAWLGAAAGATAGAAMAHLWSASGAEVAVPATAGLLGLGIGTGAGLLFPGAESRPTRIGAVVGPAAMMGLAMQFERRLRLADAPAPAAAPMALSGAAFGGAWGLLLAGATDPSGFVSDTPGRRLAGGALMGASAGIASGLVLSKRYDPGAGDVALTFASSGLGTAFGLGLPELLYAQPGRHDTIGALAGSVGGMLGGTVLASNLTLRGADAGVAAIGGGYGVLIGTLAPSMFESTWDGGRRAGGGALLGVSVGAAGATAAARLADASPGQIAAVSVAGTLGIGAGLGAGLMLPTDSLQPARAGTVIGPLAMMALSLAAEPRLRLGDGLGPGGGATGGLGAAFGIADGLLVAGAIDPSGLLGQTPFRQAAGGALLGASLEMGAGFVLSKRFAFHGDAAAVMTGGKLAGALLGAGAARLATAEAGRADTLATLGGSLGGLAGAALAEEVAPLDDVDATAALAGVGFGGFLGALAPRLGETSWTGFDRKTTGGTLAGLSLGAFGAAALRHRTDAPAEAIGLAVAGGADGLLTGLGVGLLAQGTEGDRSIRLGMAAGTVAGLGIGMGVWSRLTLGPGDPGFIAASTAVGGWTALWIPALGNASSDSFPGRQMAGAALAGAGAASFAATALVPRLEIDDDLTVNALGMDAMLSGAGAGIGALASRRADAPVWGLLAGGTAGLIAGAALHGTIDLDNDDAPLLGLAAGEGAWLGGWLPHLVRGSGAVTDRDRAGALAGAGLGALGLATLASGQLHVSPAEAGYTAFGSAIGASIAGGSALLDPAAGSQRRVGLLLGGTGVGLLGGTLLAPGLEQRGGAPAGAGALGGALGASEALVFAWSGRAQSSSDYGGAVLVGAGVGAALGIASSASDVVARSAPASAGFAAWGAWVGSFAGSFAQRDAHEVVLGGLIGANAGLLGGQILLRTETVEPRDFGWLSLFGAIGTVAGAGVGAPFSTQSDPRPVLAGLAIGPAVGMLAGALVLPRLRKLGGPASAPAADRNGDGDGDGGGGGGADRPAPSFHLTSLPSPVVRGWVFMRGDDDDRAAAAHEDRVPDRIVTSADILATAARANHSDIARVVRSCVQITDWAPMIGALPIASAADSPAPTPMLLGVTGLWK